MILLASSMLDWLWQTCLFQGDIFLLPGVFTGDFPLAPLHQTESFCASFLCWATVAVLLINPVTHITIVLDSLVNLSLNALPPLCSKVLQT